MHKTQPVLSPGRTDSACSKITNAILVCGGSVGSYPQPICSMYNISTAVWTAVASMPIAIAYFPMCAMHGKAYTFGGRNSEAIPAILCLTCLL